MEKILTSELDAAVEAMHHLNSWLRSLEVAAACGVADHFGICAEDLRTVNPFSVNEETRERIYTLKKRMIVAAEAEGMAYNALIKVKVTCNRCGGTGIYQGWYHPQNCKKCYKGTATLKFVQTTIHAGRYVWHTPLEKYHGPWGHFPEVDAPPDWTPNQVGQSLEQSQVTEYLVQVETYLNHRDEMIATAVRARRQEMKRLSLRAFCKLWECDAEFETDGRHRLYIYEPLDTDAPADAKPYTYLGDRVDFRDAANEVIAAGIRYRDFEGCVPSILHIDGAWYEVGGGKVVWHKNQWCVRHVAWRNSRFAHLANYGIRAYRDPDLDIGWQNRAQARLSSKAHLFKARWSHRRYWFKQHLTWLGSGRRYRIYGMRCKQALFLIPGIEFHWPNGSDKRDQSGYAVSVQWCQWILGLVIFAKKKLNF